MSPTPKRAVQHTPPSSNTEKRTLRNLACRRANVLFHSPPTIQRVSHREHNPEISASRHNTIVNGLQTLTNTEHPGFDSLSESRSELLNSSSSATLVPPTVQLQTPLRGDVEQTSPPLISVTTSGSDTLNPVAPNNTIAHPTTMENTNNTTGSPGTSRGGGQRSSNDLLNSLIVTAPPASESSGSSSSEQTPTPAFPLAMPSNLSFNDWLSLIRAFQSPAPPFPEFNGLDHEDPQKFIESCERYFQAARTENDQRTQLVGKGLRGDSQKWWALYKNLSFTWEGFQEHFLNKYSGPTVVMRLQASLYSQRQGDKEPVAVFLQQKYLLAQRLNTTFSAVELTNLLLESLKPTLRRLVRPTNPRSFPELLESAIKAEQDEADCAPRKPAPSKEEPQRKAGPEVPQSKPQRLPACHYCPEFHYHRDCPVYQAQRKQNLPENWRAPAAASPSAPDLPRTRVQIGRREIVAEIDSCASHNFVRLAILTAHERSLLKPGPTQAKLAANGATVNLHGSINLSPQIGDQCYPGTFLACSDLRADLVLGRAWLKDHDVHHEHRADCLYLGKENRRQIYLTPLPVSLSGPSEPLPFDLSSIPDEYKERFQQILKLYEAIFYKGGPLRQTLAASHEIRIANPRPFRAAPRRYSEPKKKFIDSETREMLAQNVIEPVTTDYSAAIVVVPKPGGGYRLCLDYRPVNDQTEDAPQSLPRIHEILKHIGTSKIFSTLDFKSGYWQIPMAPESKKYTAFSTPDGGQYQFRVMPFGLKNAPGTFQNLMRKVLASFWGEFCIAYLDDIIIFSDTWKNHLRHVALVLERILTFGLTCTPAKCRFGQGSLPYLGHVVTADGNTAQTRHIDAIQNATPPTNRKKLASFLGTCNWLMEYVPRYADLTAPLTNLLSPKRVYKWTQEHQTAFEAVKMAFKQPQVLSRPDPNLVFILQVENSNIGMGAVLFQETLAGERRIISYSSAKFSPTETRYPVDEQSCLTIVWAFKKYRPYLEDRPFILRTDKKALTWLNQSKTSRPKLTRWHILLGEFNYSLEHTPKKNSELPNALSTDPDPLGDVPGDADLDRMLYPQKNALEVPTINAIYAPTLQEEIADSQQADPLISRQMGEWLTIQQNGPINDRERAFYEGNRLDGSGFWKRCPSNGHWQLRVPVALKQRVVWEYHDVPLAGHPGVEETTRSIKEYFFWPNMSREIRRYISKCHLCLCSKPIHHRVVAGQKPRKPHSAWETVALDLMGPYPLTTRGNRFILVVTDLFTRWVEAFPIRNSNASTIIKILEDEVFSRFGYPHRILSDNGPQFRSNLWAEAGKNWTCTLWTTPEYHPQANPTERRNQEVKKGLRLRLHDGNQRVWDQQLPKLLFGLRRRRNAATGVTPAHLVFGREIRRPGEWQLQYGSAPEQQTPVQQREAAAYKHQTQYQKRYAGVNTEPPFKVGDLVYAKNTRLSNAAERYNARLAPTRTGPYPVQEIVSPGVLWIQKEDGPHKVYSSELILAPSPHQQTIFSAPTKEKSDGRSTDPKGMANNPDGLLVDEAEQAQATTLLDHSIAANPSSTVCDCESSPSLQSRHRPTSTSTDVRLSNNEIGNNRCSPSDEAANTDNNSLDKENISSPATEQVQVTVTQPNIGQSANSKDLHDNVSGRYPHRQRNTVTYRDARPYTKRR
ncbi:uncharacterized protein LOC127277975 [Leptopilina boulardi]|uniref:uncharacterized protein LOC127277975 n=1 Tax=Leptopilina boulardi TaxID=63433 RepID=UPI0021F5EB80|nr:uncharacterized protein LOC127277975 [Leptopilina boulardi]